MLNIYVSSDRIPAELPKGAGRQDRLSDPLGDPRARAPGAAGHHRGAAVRRSNSPRPSARRRSPACPRARTDQLPPQGPGALGYRGGTARPARTAGTAPGRPGAASWWSGPHASPQTALAETAVLEVFLDRARALATVPRAPASEPASGWISWNWRRRLLADCRELAEIAAGYDASSNPTGNAGWLAADRSAAADRPPHRPARRVMMVPGPSPARRHSGPASSPSSCGGRTRCGTGPRGAAALVQHRAAGAARRHDVDAPVAEPPVIALARSRPGAAPAARTISSPATTATPFLAGRERLPARVRLGASHAGQA